MLYINQSITKMVRYFGHYLKTCYLYAILNQIPFMENLLEQLQQLLKQKKANSYYAEKLGVTEQEVKELREELKSRGEVRNEVEDAGSATFPEQSIKYDYDNGKIQCSGIYESPISPEDIIAIHKIDTTQYKLSNYWSVQSEKGWRISAHFSKIKQEEEALIKFQEFLAEYKPVHVFPFREDLKNSTFVSNPSCAVLSLTDFHLDKKNITEETMDEKVRNYKEALHSLVRRAYLSSHMEEIVFVIGNDFFQTDTIHSTTTSGTPVDSDSTWDKAYEVGFDLMVYAIDYLTQFCDRLKVVLVPGNHCRTKEFYLAHALEVYFRSDSKVVFDRTADNLKVHTYGNTFFGFNHGDCTNDKLPLAFATSFPKEWGLTTYREIVIGDKHHNSQKLFKSQGEDMGVRMRMLPSLTGTDAWHKKNLFINAVQAGIILIYDKEMGKVSEFEHRIKIK